MAIITLRQLLHRPAPGGPIDPNDPLPARLYGPNGEPIGTQDDALKVTLSGQNARFEIVTLLDAATIAANSNLLEYVDALDGGPNEIFMLVNIDQQPWSFRANPGPWAYGEATISSSTAHDTFPLLRNVTRTYTSLSSPRTALWVIAQEDPYPSVQDAYYMRQIGGDSVRVAIFNHSNQTATVTLRAMKVWRY